MSRRTVIVGTLAVATACSPFGGSAEEPTDGGLEAGASGTVDGGPNGLDATALDGATTRSPCAVQHSFCEDFDGPPPWTQWNRVVDEASPIVADTTRFVSPPASLHLVVQPDPTRTDHPSFLHHKLAASQHVRLTAELAVTRSMAPAPDGEIDVLALELDKPPGFDRYFVAIVAHADGSYILETKYKRSGQTEMADPRTLGSYGGGFATVALDLDLDAGTVILTFDARSPIVVPMAQAQGTGARLAVGASWASNKVGTYSVNVDNVVVDL